MSINHEYSQSVRTQLIDRLTSFICKQWLYETLLYDVRQTQEAGKELSELDDFLTSLWLISDKLDPIINRALVELVDISPHDKSKSFRLICDVLDSLVPVKDRFPDEFPFDYVMTRQDIFEDEVRLILESIRKTKDINEAMPFFEALDRVGLFLSKKLYSTDLELTDDLTDFLREFERIDDEDTLKSLYDMIKRHSKGIFGGLRIGLKR